MVVIGRYINGITLNPLEYILTNSDKDSPVKQFESEEVARDYLSENGVLDEDMEDFEFEPYTPELDDVEV